VSRAALEPTRWDDGAYRARAAEAKTRSIAEAGRSIAEDLAEALAELDDAAVNEALMSLSPLAWSRLLWSWEFWSRQKQREPPGEWLVWLILTGRNFGKTRTAAEWVRDRVCSGKARVIGLVGPTHGDIRKFMLGGHLSQSRDGTPRLDAKRQNSSGLLDVFPPHQRPHFDVTKGEVHFHTGAVAFLTTAEEPEMRGGNFDTIWGDELAKWRYLEELWYNLEMTCRVPPSPRILITTTPKNLPRLRALIADPDTHVTLGHTNENAAHTAATWLAKMMRSYAGTRTGDQELGGEILEDNEGALWTSPEIEDHRVFEFPTLKEIAVSVDPAVSKTRRSDETGIVVDGLGADNGHIYTLADKTKKYASEEWGDVVIAEWERWSKVAPTVIVVERNRQGDGAAANVRAAMYRRTVKRGGDDAKAASASNALRIHQVLAMGEKAQRAEPVAMLAKRGFVHHVGPRDRFKMLEAEKTGWDPNVNPDSPNAIDAHVHGVTYLIPEIAGAAGAEDPRDRFRGLEVANRAMEEPGAENWDVIA
jgi:phage terminase large subunit-like protein